MRAEKEACCAVLKQLNQTLTVPSDDPALNPKHKYHLRGVIASPDELYMCRPGDHESETDDAVKNSLEPHQWSKCSWVSGAESPVKFEVRVLFGVAALLRLLTADFLDRKPRSRMSRTQCSPKTKTTR